MTKRRFATALAIGLGLAGCANPQWKLYEGPQKDPHDLAVFNLWNYPGFFGRVQIYTVSFDAENFESKRAVGLVPAAGGQVSALPGMHTVRVSFVDSDNVFLPAAMESRVFPGWYEISFEAKAGMFYAPTLNAALPKDRALDEMCIAEVSQDKGQSSALAATRTATTYVACANATMDTKVDKEKWCLSWAGGNQPLPCKHE